MFTNLKGKLNELQAQLVESTEGLVEEAKGTFNDHTIVANQAHTVHQAPVEGYDEWPRDQLIRQLRRVKRSSKHTQQQLVEARKAAERLQRTVEEQQDKFSKRIKERNEVVKLLQGQNDQLTKALSGDYIGTTCDEMGNTEHSDDVQPIGEEVEPREVDEEKLKNREGSHEGSHTAESDNMKSLRTQLLQMMRKLEQSTIEQEKAHQEAALLRSQLADLQATHQAVSQKCSQQAKQMERMTKDMLHLRGQGEEEQRRAIRAEESLAKLKKEYSQMKSQWTAAQQDIHQAERQRTALERQITHLEERASTWEERYKGAQAAKGDVKDQVVEVQAKLVSCEDCLSETSRRAAGLEDEVSHLQAMQQKHLDALEVRQRESEEQQAIIQELQTKVAEAACKLNNANKEKEEYKDMLAVKEEKMQEEEELHKQALRTLNKKMVELKRTLGKHVRAEPSLEHARQAQSTSTL
eukprot:Ihof_evm15s109 gene=Ihof_evmTU15s109